MMLLQVPVPAPVHRWVQRQRWPPQQLLLQLLAGRLRQYLHLFLLLFLQSLVEAQAAPMST